MTEDLLQVARAIGNREIPPYQTNECYTAGAFDLIIFSGNDRGINFELLSSLCDRYNSIKSDEKHLKGYLYLLNQLTYATQTTERPKGMARILEENQDGTEELHTWYRENR